jgi:hypothetical protein
MRKSVTVFALVCLVVIVTTLAPVATTPASAQGQTTTCDSTLITLLYVAEHDYGFKPAMDVAQFEKGQYKPFFDAMMAMGSADTMATKDASMAATQDASMMATKDASMAATQDTSMMGTKDNSMAVLKPGVVQGENAACTQLRAEVESYLFGQFAAKMK